MKSIRRAIGLAVLTLLVVILFGRSPWLINFQGKQTLELSAVAQSPTPTELPSPEVSPETEVTPSTEVSPETEATPEALPSPFASPEPSTETSPEVEATPTESPSPVASPEPEPEPEVTPSPVASPEPEPEVTPSPVASPEPEPEVTPSPVASPEPEPEPAAVETLVPVLPLAGEPYLDPAQRFQVGIIEGFSVTSLAGSPLIESPDGNLAYTVVVRSRAFDNNLSDAALAQIAVDTFEQGEGFIPGEFQSIGDGVVISWAGSLTLRGNTQPISGLILSRQVPGNVLVMLISATEEGQDKVEAVLSTVANSLQSI
ncbi:hypothetical protein [Oscillatoria salina]|uniref:hypothetical protein n=1 Tax=Oscillatoria salina TaxID=331517 RepID=UPI0013B9C67E|nr:hypothetical protein [Oscillatoria salina]MBZ8179185.1 hypothetical protein [Oscillatoria salina IIICB1]NET88030.1 hypothetical protein [Kamptonema sp. SIO1D9]